jgi:hypothetical protein
VLFNRTTGCCQYDKKEPPTNILAEECLPEGYLPIPSCPFAVSLINMRLEFIADFRQKWMVGDINKKTATSKLSTQLPSPA